MTEESDRRDIRCHSKKTDNGRHGSLYKSDASWFEVTSSVRLHDPVAVHASVIISKLYCMYKEMEQFCFLRYNAVKSVASQPIFFSEEHVASAFGTEV